MHGIGNTAEAWRAQQNDNKRQKINEKINVGKNPLSDLTNLRGDYGRPGEQIRSAVIPSPKSAFEPWTK